MLRLLSSNAISDRKGCVDGACPLEKTRDSVVLEVVQDRLRFAVSGVVRVYERAYTVAQSWDLDLDLEFVE